MYGHTKSGFSLENIIDILHIESKPFILSELVSNKIIYLHVWEYLIRHIAIVYAPYHPEVISTLCKFIQIPNDNIPIVHVGELIDIICTKTKCEWVTRQLGKPKAKLNSPNSSLLQTNINDDLEIVLSLHNYTKRTISKLWKPLQNDYQDLYQLEILQSQKIPKELPLLLVLFRYYESNDHI